MENNSTKKIIVVALAFVSVALFVILALRGCSKPETQPEDEYDYGMEDEMMEPISQTDVSSGDWIMDDAATEEMDTIPVGVETPAAETPAAETPTE